jgi:hypothetical protein
VIHPIIANAAAETLLSYVPKAAPVAPGVHGYGSVDADAPFASAARFGASAASIVLASTLLGYSLDDFISSRLRLPGGWGPVIGAVGAVVATNAVAGLSQGPKAATGYAVGGAAALVPAAVAAYALNKSTKDDTTVRVLALIAGGTVLYGVYRGIARK